MAAAAAAVSLVIYFDEPEGRKLLSDVQDGLGCYQPILHSIFSQQTTRAGCGIQSCALLLSANAIGCHITSSRHHRHNDTFAQSPVPSKRQKKDSTDKSGRAKTYSPGQALVLEQSSKQTSRAERDDLSDLVARAGYVSDSSVFNLPYTEVGLYSMPQTLTVTSREWVASHGLTLPEVAGILRAHGCTVWTVHSSSATVSQFRRDLIDVLASAYSCSGMILNFHRGPLSVGETKARKSHHSPVVAYHKASDKLLVLDTAAPIERHFWTSVDAMFAAMLTIDHVSGISRGYCFFIKSPT